MTNIKKNIETCRGEDVLAEVSAAPQDPHFGSLVNEALDPLKQQALHQAGYDGYSEVIEQHKPYTFASAIIQMKSNLLLLLRALWQFPFGSGTLRSLSDDASLRSLSDDASLRSLSDMWQHYITRLQGNETYGIPSRLSSLTDLPSAPLLVADRKISNGYSDTIIPDGASLARCIMDSELCATVTEVYDDNSWGQITLTARRIFDIFPNASKFTIGCSSLLINNAAYTGFVNDRDSVKEIAFSVMTKIELYGNDRALIYKCSNLEVVDARSLSDIISNYVNTAMFWGDQPKLRWLRVGKITGSQVIFCGNSGAGSRPNLIHLELGAGTNVSLSSLQYWNPTNALDASLDTLVTDEDCHNNLEQFLKNFRTYIALRLAEQPVGNPNNKTLTLSQAVYDAIKDESHLFVFDEGTMTIYAYLTNIKHWTVTK